MKKNIHEINLPKWTLKNNNNFKNGMRRYENESVFEELGTSKIIV
jgi:hypothetical protein